MTDSSLVCVGGLLAAVEVGEGGEGVDRLYVTLWAPLFYPTKIFKGNNSITHNMCLVLISKGECNTPYFVFSYASEIILYLLLRPIFIILFECLKYKCKERMQMCAVN